MSKEWEASANAASIVADLIRFRELDGSKWFSKPAICLGPEIRNGIGTGTAGDLELPCVSARVRSPECGGS
jgi:hypothetical protein